jgi:hypothetical protein
MRRHPQCQYPTEVLLLQEEKEAVADAARRARGHRRGAEVRWECLWNRAQAEKKS